MTTPSASSKTPTASAPPPPSWSSESSSEWRKRKAHTDDGCKVFQVQVVEQPMGKTFLPKSHPDVQERIECGFEAEGERVVCNLNALLGKGGMELVEAELPESPEVQGQEIASPAPRHPPSPIHPPAGLPPTQSAYAIATRRGGQRWSTLVSAPTSRVARILRPVLGEVQWCRFVVYANAYYKDAFVAAFDGPVLACVGRGGTPCPRAFRIDLSVSADGLRHLHLEDLQVTRTGPAGDMRHVEGGVAGGCAAGVARRRRPRPALPPPLWRARRPDARAANGALPVRPALLWQLRGLLPPAQHAALPRRTRGEGWKWCMKCVDSGRRRSVYVCVQARGSGLGAADARAGQERGLRGLVDARGTRGPPKRWHETRGQRK